MRGTWRRAPAIVLALTTLVVFSAAALPNEEGDSGQPQVSTVVVGDLLLADADEAPRDGVEQSFYAANMAPGDVVQGRLHVVREPFQSLREPLRTKVAISFVAEGEVGPMATYLRLEALTYGGIDLRPVIAVECGRPLTMERLFSCTEGPANPLDNLPDPTTEGKDLVLAVRFDEEVGNEAQGAAQGFRVRVELEAELLAYADHTSKAFTPSPPGDPGLPERPEPDPEDLGDLPPPDLPDGPLSPVPIPNPCHSEVDEGLDEGLAALTEAWPRSWDDLPMTRSPPEFPHPLTPLGDMRLYLLERLPEPCRNQNP